MVGRTGGGVDAIIEDERERQRDDADINVADARIEHEIAERGGKQRPQQHREQKRRRALANIDNRDRISVGAESEKGRVAKAQDAAIAPDERETERQDAEDG